jgi:hypothetical protein
MARAFFVRQENNCVAWATEAAAGASEISSQDQNGAASSAKPPFFYTCLSTDNQIVKQRRV